MNNPFDLGTEKQRFRRRLRSLRNKKGLSRERLSNRTAELFDEPVSDDTIEAIEMGRRDPSLDVIFKLAAALDVRACDLFGFEDNETTSLLRFENVVKELPTEVIPATAVEPVEEAVAPPRQRKSDLETLQDALEGVQKLQALGDEYGITDVFQDNGGKLLQVLILLGLRKTDGREGNDAVDEAGNEYELKSVNVALSNQVTTHHHLNLDILAKYRRVQAWYIAMYYNIRLIEIWMLTPEQLEEKFTDWEGKLGASDNKPINNPKIPLKLVRKNGELVYRDDDYNPPPSPSKRGGGPRKPKKPGGRRPSGEGAGQASLPIE